MWCGRKEWPIHSIPMPLQISHMTWQWQFVSSFLFTGIFSVAYSNIFVAHSHHARLSTMFFTKSIFYMISIHPLKHLIYPLHIDSALTIYTAQHNNQMCWMCNQCLSFLLWFSLWNLNLSNDQGCGFKCCCGAFPWSDEKCGVQRSTVFKLHIQKEKSSSWKLIVQSRTSKFPVLAKVNSLRFTDALE